MKDWNERQLRSWLDAHDVFYGSQPPALKDRHYKLYLLSMVNGARNPVPKPSSEIEIANENQSASEAFTGITVACPICMAPDCDCNIVGKWVYGD